MSTGHLVIRSDYSLAAPNFARAKFLPRLARVLSCADGYDARMNRRFQFSLKAALLAIALLAAYISLIRAIGGPAWRIMVLSAGAAAASGASGMLCLAQAMRMADTSDEPRLSAALIVLLGLCLFGAAMLSLVAPLLFFNSA